MNEIEHLLSVLGEEGCEVAQAASKANRFGPQDGYPNTNRTNARDICKEFAELEAVMEMLEERGVLHMDPQLHAQHKREKRARVLEYMEYARARGALDSPAPDAGQPPHSAGDVADG